MSTSNAPPRETEAELRALCAEAADALECALEHPRLPLANYLSAHYRDPDLARTLDFAARLRKAGAR